MKLGFVGVRDPLLARRLLAAGVHVHACAAEPLEQDPRVVLLANAVAVAQALSAPRVIVLDLPDGFATELAIQDIWPECLPGDVIVDLAAGTAADARRRAASLASVRMHFVDGYAAKQGLALGGSAEAMRIVAPYADLAGTWTHAGPSGSGYHARLDAGESA